jgi:2-keto-4-pentenoate hydratase/2-oxohepta-3-ene-1,7-dioic acid hydratase in catechol pathway
VIGKRARYLPHIDSAKDCIAGYAISNDVSEHHFQIERSGGQWSKGKSFETFNPLGPWLVTSEDLDPHDLQMSSTVNGQLRQASNTADMIFPVEELVHAVSQILVLEPGDLINTGTPEGVALFGRFPYLKTGDTVQLTIERLGERRARITDPTEVGHV